jgi:hypothetical protein
MVPVGPGVPKMFVVLEGERCSLTFPSTDELQVPRLTLKLVVADPVTVTSQPRFGLTEKSPAATP